VSLLTETVAAIKPASTKAMAAAEERQSILTKPRGSLGALEGLGTRLCGMYAGCPPPLPAPVAIAVFAGDHGVHAQGVTPWPQEVTAQMVGNFLAGGAVIDALGRQVGAGVVVVDMGVAGEVPQAPNLIARRIAAGLGEGSGAALAVPLVQASARILREVASFDSAGVTDKV
jgi:nicotinate-nucleotide--dimethylbenzimidazole phosphoribosyltransferase